MNTPALKEQIADIVDRLSAEQQQEVLDFARKLQRPKGVPARSLLKFAGRIPLDDVERMEEAIKDFEEIDLNEW